MKYNNENNYDQLMIEIKRLAHLAGGQNSSLSCASTVTLPSQCCSEQGGSSTIRLFSDRQESHEWWLRIGRVHSLVSHGKKKARVNARPTPRSSFLPAWCSSSTLRSSLFAFFLRATTWNSSGEQRLLGPWSMQSQYQGCFVRRTNNERQMGPCVSAS